MTKPTISVLIPAFKAKDTILRCIRSLLADEAARGVTEIIVESDDGEDYCWLANGWPEVKANAPSQYKSGPGATRNRALASATGEWITYVDADDVVEPGYIGSLIETASRRGAAIAQTRVVKGKDHLLHFGQTGRTLDLAEWSRTGVSLRVCLHRTRFPSFHDDPAQDIMHTIQSNLGHLGRLEFSDAIYVLQVGEMTVTTQPKFKASVADAYLRHVRFLKQNYEDSPLLSASVDFWMEKHKLNKSFQAAGGSPSFYEFVAARVHECS